MFYFYKYPILNGSNRNFSSKNQKKTLCCFFGFLGVFLRPTLVKHRIMDKFLLKITQHQLLAYLQRHGTGQFVDFLSFP